MSDTALSIPTERIEQAIVLIRGHKVMLDADLAVLYGVTTSNLNKAVARNRDRFPHDFMFQLTLQEFRNLTFQSGISSAWGGRRTPPYAFTEQGVAVLSKSTLRSCGPSSASASCWLPMPSSLRGSQSLSRNTMPSSRSCLMRSGS